MTPDRFKIASLPKWAREYITKLERERTNAVDTLREFTDNQTPTCIWYEEWSSIGEKNEPSILRRYIQARDISFRLTDQEINVGFYDDRGLHISATRGPLIVQPRASNVIIVSEGD